MRSVKLTRPGEIFYAEDGFRDVAESRQSVVRVAAEHVTHITEPHEGQSVRRFSVLHFITGREMMVMGSVDEVSEKLWPQ